MNSGNKPSEKFSGKIGFILAAAASAIGLGNIWRFPYFTAKYGGGIFLLTYLVLVLTFGYALLISENAVGRMTGKGPIGSYRQFCGKGWERLVGIGGWINAIVPLLIVPYYCVIGGWVTKYTAAFFYTPISDFSAAKTVVTAAGKSVSFSANYFANFITSTWEPIFYFLIFMAILVLVVAMGVQKGIERSSKILMPILFLMIIAVCIYSAFLPGARAGFSYYLMPDFSKFSLMTVVAAMGQMFFSLSIAMGIMITYGSYMRKEENISACVRSVEFCDTAVAILAGMMIIPAVVAFGGEKAAETAGPGLVFITMPQVFAGFPGGQYVSIIFFLLVLFAAATSAISLLETNVQTLSQELHISRKTAIFIGVCEIISIGVITILGYSILSFFRPFAFTGIAKIQGMDILDSLDFISNNLMMPVAAIFTTLLVTAVIGLNRIGEEIKIGNEHWRGAWLYRFCMRFVVIPCLLIILLDSFGVF